MGGPRAKSVLCEPGQEAFETEFAARLYQDPLRCRERESARKRRQLQQLEMFTPGWMGQSDRFDMGYVCDDAGPGGPLDGLVPAVVAYVIAFTARRDENLQDCNVGSPSLTILTPILP